jgi:HPt (histidine-containing phosphotransfer) domain-containing protein
MGLKAQDKYNTVAQRLEQRCREQKEYREYVDQLIQHVKQLSEWRGNDPAGNDSKMPFPFISFKMMLNRLDLQRALQSQS